MIQQTAAFNERRSSSADLLKNSPKSSKPRQSTHTREVLGPLNSFIRSKPLTSSFGRLLSERQRAALAVGFSISRPLSADFTQLFHGNYWADWDEMPRKKLQLDAPFSLVRAILTTSGSSNALQQQSIIVIFSEGEVLSFSPENNWSEFEWRCVVIPPVDLTKKIDNFKVFHAAYDSVTDDIFFTVEDDSLNQPYIFHAGRRQLQRPEHLGFVQLGHFITSKWGIFGISVDSKRRLLFGCEYVANVINIWRITQAEKTPRLMAKITSVTWPRFIAPFFDDNNNNNNDDSTTKKTPQVKIAVSRTSNNEVVILQAKLAIFTERVLKIANNHNDNNNVVDDIFTTIKLLPITNESRINSPEELTFDRNGNLFIADCRNNRFQIYASIHHSHMAMQNVWTSTSCTNYARRFALVGKHPRTGKPAMLVGKGNVVEWYY